MRWRRARTGMDKAKVSRAVAAFPASGFCGAASGIWPRVRLILAGKNRSTRNTISADLTIPSTG